MMKLGGWNVDVPHDKYPQKIATAISDLNSLIGMGCEYEAIAYLGCQIVNGTNHAVLAQQTVLNGKDINNAVVIVLNEKPGASDVSVTDIRRIVEGSDGLGGTKVEMSQKIPESAMQALNTVLDGWTGAKITPIAYVGTQVTKGTNYIMVAEVKAVVPGAIPDLAVITVNALENKIQFERLFEIGTNDDPDQLNKLSYAFTWLSKPLGEWP